MKKFLAIIGIIFSFLIIYFLQVNFFNWFNIAGIKPNLFIILVLVVGLFAGKKVGAITGLLLGIYLDILNGKSIGFSGIALMGIGIAGGYLDKTFSKDSKITIILIVIGSTIAYELITYIYNVLKFAMLFELAQFLKILIIEIVFNILITIIIYPLIQKLGYKLEKIFKKEKILTRYF